MHFLEYETWRLRPGIDPAGYEKIIQDWFKYVSENRETLFPEWISAKYYRKTDIDGLPTGEFVMLFEYDSLEGHHAYKERRKNWDGPYTTYKSVDPYQEYFELTSVTTEYFQPLEVDKWFTFPSKTDDPQS